MKAMDILAGDHRQRFLVSDHSVLTCIILDSSPREPRFVLVPLRFASRREPRSASNANKPASGPKKVLKTLR